MIDESIQAGDVVAFTSGGHAMTVQACSQTLVYCAWMAEGRLHQGTFEVASLHRLRRAGPRARSQPANAASSDPLP
jgi:uncharacterized protein YodC (DUF2158 family)